MQDWERAQRIFDRKPMTLGELIKALSRFKSDEEVKFDFVHFKPNMQIHSYRGDYSQLAVGYTSEYKQEDDVTVGNVLAMLKGAIGKTFEGYKGGDYTMDEETPIWVGDTNESGSTAIVGVEKLVYVTIRTEMME